MNAPSPPTRLLFVCSGNICRSPTAEGVFRRLAEKHGVAARFAVDSAGIHGLHVGEPPDPRAAAVAASRGYDIRALRARQVTRADLGHFDLVLGMDEGHVVAARRLLPSAPAGRISLFLSHWDGAPCRDVPDPYYGDERDFAYAFELIEKGAVALLEKALSAPGAFSGA